MTKRCHVCGGPLPPSSGNNRKYCSPKCARKAATRKNMALIQTRARGRVKYYSDVIFAYDARCAICGWSANLPPILSNGKRNFSDGTEIHHVTSIANGGDDDFGNLILLCPNCHKLAHLGVYDENKLRKHQITHEQLEIKTLESHSKVSMVLSDLFFGD